MAYSSQGIHTNQLNFCNWLAEGFTVSCSQLIFGLVVIGFHLNTSFTILSLLILFVCPEKNSVFETLYNLFFVYYIIIIIIIIIIMYLFCFSLILKNTHKTGK